MQNFILNSKDFEGLTKQEIEFKKQIFEFYSKDLLKQESSLREKFGSSSKYYIEGIIREKEIYEKRIKPYKDNNNLKAHYEKFVTGSDTPKEFKSQVTVSNETLIKSIEADYQDSIRVNDIHQIKNYYDKSPIPELMHIGATSKEVRNHYKRLNDNFVAESVTYGPAFNFMKTNQARELSDATDTEHRYSVEKKHDFEVKLFHHLDNLNSAHPTNETAKPVIDAFIEYKRTLGVKVEVANLNQEQLNKPEVVSKVQQKPIKPDVSPPSVNIEPEPIFKIGKPNIAQQRLRMKLTNS